MKKILFAAALIVATQFGFAQNLQLHYDFLKNANDPNASGRGYLISTVELFKADKYGSTYFFTDLDFNSSRGGNSQAYSEIDRDQRIGDCPILAHLEYNGGFNQSVSFNNAWLFGASYPFKIKNGSMSFYAAYKAISTEKANAQFTTIWFKMMAKGKLTFEGFMDIWSEDNTGSSGKKIIILTKPKLWYNVTPNLSVGSRVEISNNFVFNSNRVEIFPTIGAKWNFL
jgi:hypothetical protein